MEITLEKESNILLHLEETMEMAPKTPTSQVDMTLKTSTSRQNGTKDRPPSPAAPVGPSGDHHQPSGCSFSDNNHTERTRQPLRNFSCIHGIPATPDNGDPSQFSGDVGDASQPPGGCRDHIERVTQIFTASSQLTGTDTSVLLHPLEVAENSLRRTSGMLTSHLWVAPKTIAKRLASLREVSRASLHRLETVTEISINRLDTSASSYL